ncbi:MAG: DNA-binding protein [Rhodocyclaceae bacterium]|nr:DNA-binding protein [Rhodocyclaceae bacterium]
MPTETLGITELAALLHLAPSTIRSDVSRRPWMLPPFIKLGIKTVWLRTTVLDWLKAKEQSAAPPAPPELPPATRRRGRPSKLDQLRQQRSTAAAEAA